MAGEKGDIANLQDLGAERYALACCMESENGLLTVLDILDAEDYAHPPHRLMHKAFEALWEAGTIPDIITLSDQLRRDGNLEAVGPEYVIGMPTVVGTAANARHYARIVKEKSNLRKLVKIGHMMSATAGRSNGKSSKEITNEFYGRMLDVLSNEREDIIDLEKAIREASEIQKKWFERDMYGRLKTGFPILDSVYTMQPETLTTVGGYTSCGKSAFVLNIANNMIHAGIPVLYITLEISRRVILYRLAALNSQVVVTSYVRGYVKDLESDPGIRAVREFKGLFFIADFDHASEVDIVLAMQRHMTRHPDTGLIIVDYLQNVDCERHPNESRHRQISSIMRYFRGAAKRLGIPIMVVSQLSRPQRRDGKFRPASRYDLKESGDIETNSDMILLINRLATEEDKSTEWHAVIDVSKQNMGITGHVEMYFIGKHMRFEEQSIPPEIKAELNIRSR